MSVLPRGDEPLTLEAAYLTACMFLEAYWERGGKVSDDLAVLLGSMQMYGKGWPLDRAMWHDFLEAADQAKAALAAHYGRSS